MLMGSGLVSTMLGKQVQPLLFVARLRLPPLPCINTTLSCILQKNATELIHMLGDLVSGSLLRPTETSKGFFL